MSAKYYALYIILLLFLQETISLSLAQTLFHYSMSSNKNRFLEDFLFKRKKYFLLRKTLKLVRTVGRILKKKESFVEVLNYSSVTSIKDSKDLFLKNRGSVTDENDKVEMKFI